MQFLGPVVGRQSSDLGRHDRTPLGLPRAQSIPVMEAVDGDVREAGVVEKRIYLLGVVLLAVERIRWLLSSGQTRREGDSVGRRQQHPAPGRKDATHFTKERQGFPHVLQDLQGHHSIDTARWQGEGDQVGPNGGHTWILIMDVGARRSVVINGDAPSPGQQVDAVSLTSSGIDDDAFWRDPFGAPLVGGQMSREPVLLVGESRCGALAGGRQILGHSRQGCRVGVERGERGAADATVQLLASNIGSVPQGGAGNVKECRVKIAVCVKQVPDTWAEKKLKSDDSTLDREAAEGVLNELDEYAVEEALRLVEAHGGEAVVVSMGPERAGETVRKALSMGADAGIHVLDDNLHGSDALATSAVLAKALEGRDFDLIIFGSESTDARMSVVPAMVAERLGLPQVTFCQKVEVDGSVVRAERVTDYGFDSVEGPLPAVVSVVEKINEPRYPSFKGIMAAKKKPVETLTLADLGVEPAAVGLAGAWSAVADFAERPPKAAGTVVPDDGQGGARIADYLVEQKFI